jgi:hypothetical protein
VLAARASKLSVVVHAVEGNGLGVCGARAQSQWRLSSRLPVTCPTCLLRMSRPRLAICGVPADNRREPLHLRLLSDKGFKPRAGPDTLTVCGRLPGWDEALVRGTLVRPDIELCRRCRNAAPSALDAANAVR